MAPDDEPKQPIAALRPRGEGQQFVLYGDACSGVPGALHEGKLAAVNAVIRRLVPQPEFIVFPGDEIIGLVADPEALRAQWRHFLGVEMAWLDRKSTPIWHATGNHTAYDEMSETIFAEMLDLRVEARRVPDERVRHWRPADVSAQQLQRARREVGSLKRHAHPGLGDLDERR